MKKLLILLLIFYTADGNLKAHIVNPNDLKQANHGFTMKLEVESIFQVPIGEITSKTKKEESKVQPANSEKYQFHKVKKKQTLFSIAEQYGITANDLLRNNPEVSEGLVIGQVLKIPIILINSNYQTRNKIISSSKANDNTGDYSLHPVISGETLHSMQKRVEIIHEVNSNPVVQNGQDISIKPKNGKTFKDIDGNIYKTVIIGNQVWMAENLKTTKYNDGSGIQCLTTNTEWTESGNRGGYCWYLNDIRNKNIYGALYNQNTIRTEKLAPEGWHVATEEEWGTLTTLLGDGDISGGRLKETGTTHWQSPNNKATNEVGFSGLPGGLRLGSGDFEGLGYIANWWDSPSIHHGASYRSLSNSSGYINKNFEMEGENYGRSVRFVMDPLSIKTLSVSNRTSNSAVCGGNITSDGGIPVSERGVCYSTKRYPTTSDSIMTMGFGSGTFSNTVIGLTANTTYYLRAYATNGINIVYGNEISFKINLADGKTVTDIDGNDYNTVTIGTQVWMVENLQTTRFNDGKIIPIITNYEWCNLITPALCWLENDLRYKKIEGGLYNWYAVNTGKLAPKGWHVPTDADWTILTTYLGGESVAYKKLRKAGIEKRTDISSGKGTNESGFTAIITGARSCIGSPFPSNSCTYWSSTEAFKNLAWIRDLFNISREGQARRYDQMREGLPVRCIKN